MSQLLFSVRNGSKSPQPLPYVLRAIDRPEPIASGKPHGAPFPFGVPEKLGLLPGKPTALVPSGNTGEKIVATGGLGLVALGLPGGLPVALLLAPFVWSDPFSGDIVQGTMQTLPAVGHLPGPGFGVGFPGGEGETIQGTGLAIAPPDKLNPGLFIHFVLNDP